MAFRLGVGGSRATGDGRGVLGGRAVWRVSLRADQQLDDVVETHVVVKQCLAIFHLKEENQNYKKIKKFLTSYNKKDYTEKKNTERNTRVNKSIKS